MNTITHNKLHLSSQSSLDYQWKNLIIEERNSTKWLSKLFKDSIIYSFWSVLASRTN